MALGPDALSSKRTQLTGGLDEAVDGDFLASLGMAVISLDFSSTLAWPNARPLPTRYRQGWTGLPVIPPTEEKVLRFLDQMGRHRWLRYLRDEVIGVEHQPSSPPQFRNHSYYFKQLLNC